MGVWVPRRHVGPEWIDDDSHPAAEVEGALRDLQWVNRNLSGWRVLEKTLPDLLGQPDAGRPLRVLDLGTGSADLPRAMIRWARSHRRTLEVVGIDSNREVIAFAQRECATDPEVRLVQADLFHPPFPPHHFDLVTCSLTLHHFEPADAVQLLRSMGRMSRGAILVNDLERHRVAYWSIWILSRLRGSSRMFRHDAPLSVLRAYRAGSPSSRQDRHHTNRSTQHTLRDRTQQDAAGRSSEKVPG